MGWRDFFLSQRVSSERAHTLGQGPVCSYCGLQIELHFFLSSRWQLVLCIFRQMTEIDFTEDKENFKWKGHGPLLPKEGSVSIPAGFKLQTGLQLIPAAPVSALSVETGWGLLAAGTIHGFILYDFMNKKTVTTKWTVSQGRSEIISLDVLLDFPSLILEVSGLFLLLGHSMNYIFFRACI